MALHSRAFLLLRRDLINLHRFPISGISASPNGDDLFNWNVRIQGLSGTVWEGGVFQVKLSFNEYFNGRPPEVHFMTIPFHPNVDPTDGRPIISQLTAGWSEDCTVTTVLLALQAMLGDPEMDGSCIAHEAAAHIYLRAPHTYRQMAFDCITASLRIDAGLPPHDGEEEERPQSKTLSLSSSQGKRLETQSQKSIRRKAMPISFDDYHALWKGIATSVTSYKQQDSFLDLLEKDKHLNKVHKGAAKLQHNTIDLQQKLKEYMTLKYGTGNPKSKKTAVKLKDPKQRIEELKRMYRNASTTNNEDGHNEDEQLTDGESLVLEDSHVWPQDSNDGEIDDLVQWTRELDEQRLMST